MVRLDCRKFKKQVLEKIKSLKEDMEKYLIGQFTEVLNVQVEKNKVQWERVIAKHDDIDETIAQIEMIKALLDEEIFMDLRATIGRIGQKKFFLDSMQIAVSDSDFKKFLALYSYPDELWQMLMVQQDYLSDQQGVIQDRIKKSAAETKLYVDKYALEFI